MAYRGIVFGFGKLNSTMGARRGGGGGGGRGEREDKAKFGGHGPPKK